MSLLLVILQRPPPVISSFLPAEAFLSISAILSFLLFVSFEASIEAIIIYVDSGTEATSPLIAYIDTATGLPITPNGGDIIVTWDNGTNKIFKV